MSEPIRTLLVDDQALIRIGFGLVLDAEPDIRVVGHAGDGDEAIARSAELLPDVVLMDIRMPGTDGIRATEAIVRSHPEVRVLVLTTFDLDEYAFGAIRAGASGFLLKDAQRHELTAAVRAVHRGDAVLSPRVTRRFLEHAGAGLKPDEPGPAAEVAKTLTGREREVFAAIGRGLTNAEIAQQLYLSESTVKTHVGRVLTKLGARDRIHVVILAHQLGIAR